MTITYLAAFSLVIHVFLSWILAVKYKFGLEGALVSTALAYWIPNIGVAVGWQSIVACVNIASYYLIGIPIGVVLSYTVNLQVEGVWMEMLIGTFLQIVVLVIITYRTDWEKQVSIARARVNQWYLIELKDVDPNTQDM
uniref:Uncharacterized protein n=1 Tax=Vitis vinifera TaxID=29760 RepID=F6HMV6_VITVI